MDSSPPLFPIYVRQGRSWRNYKVGYIDSNGSVRIAPEFDDGLPFSEDLAAVSIKGKWGYVNKLGEMAIAPVLKSGSYFDEGRAVTSQKKRGYINTVGEWAVPPRYDLAAGFKEGLAWVGAADLYGFVDPNGAEPIPLMY